MLFKISNSYFRPFTVTTNTLKALCNDTVADAEHDLAAQEKALARFNARQEAIYRAMGIWGRIRNFFTFHDTYYTALGLLFDVINAKNTALDIAEVTGQDPEIIARTIAHNSLQKLNPMTRIADRDKLKLDINPKSGYLTVDILKIDDGRLAHTGMSAEQNGVRRNFRSSATDFRYFDIEEAREHWNAIKDAFDKSNKTNALMVFHSLFLPGQTMQTRIRDFGWLARHAHKDFQDLFQITCRRSSTGMVNLNFSVGCASGIKYGWNAISANSKEVLGELLQNGIYPEQLVDGSPAKPAVPTGHQEEEADIHKPIRDFVIAYKKRNFSKMDFSNLYLRGLDLSGADLYEVDFTDADTTGMIVSNAILPRQELTGINTHNSVEIATVFAKFRELVGINLAVTREDDRLGNFGNTCQEQFEKDKNRCSNIFSYVQDVGYMPVLQAVERSPAADRNVHNFLVLQTLQNCVVGNFMPAFDQAGFSMLDFETDTRTIPYFTAQITNPTDLELNGGNPQPSKYKYRIVQPFSETRQVDLNFTYNYQNKNITFNGRVTFTPHFHELLLNGDYLGYGGTGVEQVQLFNLSMTNIDFVPK